jgi:hypothetical protein
VKKRQASGVEAPPKGSTGGRSGRVERTTK